MTQSQKLTVAPGAHLASTIADPLLRFDLPLRAELVGVSTGAEQLGIVINDSFGRAWRNGVVNVALGSSGLPALVDARGNLDRDGRILQVTQIAFADSLAAAAGLVMGEGSEGCPVVHVRGTARTEPEVAAAALIRPREEDLFR